MQARKGVPSGEPLSVMRRLRVNASAGMKEAAVLRIDVGSVETRDELHALLAEALDFPDYYGRNWDAFDECIRDFPPAGRLLITGIGKLGATLPEDAELLKSCLDGFGAELRARVSHDG